MFSSSNVSYQSKQIVNFALTKLKSTLTTMSSDFHIEKVLKTIFTKSVESVKPASILKNALEIQQSAGSVILKIYDKERQVTNIDITEQKIHCIGFGKAVQGMAVALEKALPSLQSGIVSVPTKVGSTIQWQSNSVIKVIFSKQPPLIKNNNFSFM
jgi:glycerate-2-kinase